MRRFGSLIDSYTIPESEADGTTVPIRYELRRPELAVADGRNLDRLFETIFEDMTQTSGPGSAAGTPTGRRWPRPTGASG